MKKNRLLVVSLSAAIVVALGLFVYAVIEIVSWSGYMERTEKARESVRKLVRQRPAPGKENEERIKKDIVVYKKAAEGLHRSFQSPLQPALQAFFETLEAPRIEVLTDEEKEQFKVPGTGIEADEENNQKAVPLKIRKLSQEDFVKFFRARFEQYCSANGKLENELNTMATLMEFIGSCKQIFPLGNWDKAIATFRRGVKPLTVEPVNTSNEIAVLLSALGFPRRGPGSTDELKRHTDAFVAEIRQVATENKLELLFDISDSFVGGTSVAKNSVADKDYPIAYFHWDVFGDIVSRLGKAEMSSLQNVFVRCGESSEENSSGGKMLNLEQSFEQIGSFRVFHYTVVCTGSMEAIRNAVSLFDQAYRAHRTYVVRSVSLYAKENGAAALMAEDSLLKDKDSQTAEVQDEDVSFRRGRRGRRRNTEELRASQDRKKEEDIQKQIREKDAKLPPHKRSDYGTILIGGSDQCIAYIDLDYVVLMNQE